MTRELHIAVLAGDGVGPELIEAGMRVLAELEKSFSGASFTYSHIDAGANCYRRYGVDIAPRDLERVRLADAIFLGAMGDPDIRYPDGTEIAPHLTMRTDFELFASVRPIRAFANVPPPLSDPRWAEIDLVIVRECSEGLFYLRQKGQVIDDAEARDTLVITRAGCERLFDFAFDLARRRKLSGGKGIVSCVDKANVLRSYAFFRKVFAERAQLNPDIIADYRYVDAMALDLVRRPWEYDVIVAENMFADILSDIGGGIVGGMGMAPCAEIGADHGVFQPAHGSAPDIAGTDRANPIATFLSIAMMLDWLGTRHSLDSLNAAAARLERCIETGFSTAGIEPIEFGGSDGTGDITDTIIKLIEADKRKT